MVRPALLFSAVLAFVAVSACSSARSGVLCPRGLERSGGQCIEPTDLDVGGVDVGVDVPSPTDVGPGPGDVSRPDIGPGPCEPICGRRQCGDDGCGGTCGECDFGLACTGDGFCAPSGAGIACAEIVDCVQFCDTEECYFDCVEQGDRRAQAQFNNVVECIQVNCAGLPDDEFGRCQQVECGEELAECFDAPLPGALECGEIVECVFGCPNFEDRCVEECFFQGNFAAQAEASELFDCGERACGDVDSVEEWFECTASACPRVVEQCFEGGGPIEPAGSCEEMVFCTIDCPPGDFDCAQECGFDGPRDAQRSFEILLECTFDNCGWESPETLIECGATECAAAFEACVGATPPPEPTEGLCQNRRDRGIFDRFGDEVFDLMNECALTCFDDEGCAFDCIASNIALSEGCAACVADDVVCAVDDCSRVCRRGLDADACTACRRDACAEKFSDCAGLDPLFP